MSGTRVANVFSNKHGESCQWDRLAFYELQIRSTIGPVPNRIRKALVLVPLTDLFFAVPLFLLGLFMMLMLGRVPGALTGCDFAEPCIYMCVGERDRTNYGK